MVTLEEKRSYRKLEDVLQKINRDFISLSQSDRDRNNRILKELLDLVTSKMTQTDSLFSALFGRIYYGGSFYDGLRVGKPDEFDIDLLLSLPKLVKVTRTLSNIPGYIELKLDMSELNKQLPLKDKYKGLEKLLDDNNYLDKNKVLRWMEGVVISSLNKFQGQNGTYILPLIQGNMYVKIHKTGPAFTLKLQGDIGGTKIDLDIDLVPCFELTSTYWPPKPFKPNPVNNKQNFFVVPKPIKNGQPVSSRFWRLSFQEQEGELINSKGFLKPSIKLLKKLRDTCQHKCIASYYIKTVALWQIEKRDSGFWTSSLAHVFMTLLKDYVDMLENGKILYYWYPKNNLIANVSAIPLSNIVGRLKRIVTDVQKHLLDDPEIIAKHILISEEYVEFKNVGNNSTEVQQIPVIEEYSKTNTQDSKCHIM